MKSQIIICLSLFIVSLFPNMVLAQFSDIQSSLGGASEIKLDPAFPNPHEQTDVSISSGVYGANITWTLNGTEMPSTQNKVSFTMEVGEMGKTQTLVANFINPDGTRGVLTKKITPFYLDLVLEPQTHVPDFYLGRSLPSLGSVVNVTAILGGLNTPESDLIYTWRIDRTVIGNGSIRGMNKASFEVPLGGFPVLSLEIKDLSGKQIASHSVFLPSANPEVLFYESNPLFGLKQTPIDGTFSLIGNTAVLKAEPYSLDSRVYNNPSTLEWNIGSQTHNPTGNPYEVTLQRVGLTGRTSLNFNVRDNKQLLQGGDSTIYINI